MFHNPAQEGANNAPTFPPSLPGQICDWLSENVLQYFVSIASMEEEDDIDKFFACNTHGYEDERKKEQSNVKCHTYEEDDFDMFFDSISQLEPEQQKNEDKKPTAINPTFHDEKRKRKSKRCKTFDLDQSSKLSPHEIQKELSMFTCCSQLLCYTWLTWQIVMACRNQYVLLSSYEDRRTWLARKMDVMKIGPATFSYQIDVLGQGTRRACARAWRFAYGVPEATHKRNMSGHSTNNKKTRRLRISTGSCLFFITWLIAFANKVGDQLPFGEGSAVVNQVRLPFPNKKMVHNIFIHFQKTENVTSNEAPVCYGAAVAAWKKDPIARHIKLAKHKEGFSQCDFCKKYDLKLSKPMTVAQRQALDVEFYAHIAETKKERAQYYGAKIKCIAAPEEKISIIMDSMDQRKTSCPFFLQSCKMYCK